MSVRASPRAVRPALLLLFVSACALPRTSTTAIWQRAPEMPRGAAATVHHEVEVTLVPAERRIAVKDVVTLPAEVRARLGDTLVFSLHAGLSPERVGGVPLVRMPGGRAPRAHAEGAGDAARVPLEFFGVTLQGDERTFTIRYAGQVFHPISGEGEEYARGMSHSPGLVTDQGAVLSGATQWLPDVSDDLISFAVDARVPAGWDVVSQGTRTRHERTGRDTIVRWASEAPQEEALLVAGPLFERSRAAGRVLVETFLRSDDAALAGRYLTAGEQYLSMYERLIGPYPYPKFALVENFWETGYGMPSFTLLGPRIIRFPFILHSSYPHEILHNWWGNGVFVEAAHGNWSEGLTAYLADHLVQEQLGEGAAYRRASLQRYADYVAASEDFPVREFRERHGSVTQAVGYDKVLMIFHMLRQKLGDERFVAALRRFYAEQRFRAASFPDLSRATSTAAGEDLAPFFAQWVDRAGAPVVKVEAADAAEGPGGHVLVLTLAQTQDAPVYELEVPIYVTLASRAQAVRRSVHLTGRRHRFTLDLEDAPVRVDVDPEYDVFRRLDPAELPPTLGGAFGAASVVIVLPSSAPAGRREAYAALADTWRRAGTQVLSDAELARIPAGKAVWVLGWENRLRERVAAQLIAYGAALSAEGLRSGSAALSRQAQAVVAAARSPADPSQVVAFLGCDDPRALPGLARKLPHYGKYSLLGFEGEEPDNVVKDTWPVLASPLSVAVGAGPLPPRGSFPPRKALAELPPAVPAAAAERAR